ncbi:MAG: phytoene desaturase [Bacteroidetes bacterium]|nr:phytoene desaturase [Bacteroidota bacterium]
MNTAVVIGSGIGGLAAAIRLSRRGYRVTVYEQHSTIGGKVHRIEQDGYSWGFGASLFTMPELLDELFILCGKDPAQYYHYTRIDPVCRYFYADGTRLDAWAETDRFAAEVQQQTGEPAVKVKQYLERIAKLYDVTKDIFLFRSLHRWRTYADRNALRSLLHLPQIGIGGKMHKANEEAFSDSRIVQLFDRYATYNGSDPYLAPATLNVISHLEYNKGAYFLEDGMPMLTRSLYQLALDMGVEFVTSCTVTGIHVEDGNTTGIKTGGAFVPADIVVSNMDVVYTYRRLMPEQQAPARYLDQPRSSSAIIFYWGMDRIFPELDLHNIFFSSDYAEEFRMLSTEQDISDDPTIYIYISSKKQPTHAPQGGENWFVLINAPHDSGQDWDAVAARVRANVIARLSRELGVDIASCIATETVNHPGTIDSKTGSYLGALYGSSSNNVLAAFLRHPNFSRSIEGLYFCGGSVHPGGGVPLCLLSAHIIDDLLSNKKA